MANIIIKSDERNAHEAMVLKSFGTNPNRATAEQRECAAQIAHDTNKVISKGGTRKW
mgnify:FL=1